MVQSKHVGPNAGRRADPNAGRAGPNAGRPGSPGASGPGARDLHGRRREQRGSPGRTLGLIVLALLVMGGAGALSAVLSGGGKPVAPKQPAGSKVAVSTSRSNQPIHATDAELLGLEKLHGQAAPGFTLADQHGQKVSLSQLDAHHVVVLGFMDDRCRDICPLVAQELVDAHHDLGAKAKTVVFVGVNVNAAHDPVATLRSWIATHGNGIGAVPGFYYLTGPPEALKKVWADYGITVRVLRTGGVNHSEGMWFIARGGAERFRATPFANERKNGTGWLPPATITQWGHGIAKYAAKVAGS